MPRRHRAKDYRQPKREELNKIFFLQYGLQELFDPEDIEDFLSVALHAVAGEFHYAKELNPRYSLGSNKRLYRCTDNYIIGVGGKPSELARYISKMTHRKIVPAKCLPSQLYELSPKLVERIVATARYDLILLSVNAMVHDGQIRYDEGRGIWEASQSSIDGFLVDKDLRRVIRRAMKNDHRPWHGRPSRDRGKMPEGVSVSFS